MDEHDLRSLRRAIRDAESRLETIRAVLRSSGADEETRERLEACERRLEELTALYVEARRGSS